MRLDSTSDCSARAACWFCDFLPQCILDNLTTTQIWIGGQITAREIMKGLSIPSMINLLLPLVATTMTEL